MWNYINRRNKKGEFIRFIITGTLGVCVQYAIYWPLCEMIDVNWAYSIAMLFYVVVNFLLTTYFTFKEQPNFKKTSGYLAQQGLNYSMQIIFLNLFIWMGISKELAPIPVFVLILPINFIILRLVFKRKKVDQ